MSPALGLEPHIKTFERPFGVVVFDRDRLELRVVSSADLRRASLSEGLDRLASAGGEPACLPEQVASEKALQGEGSDPRPSLDRLSITVTNTCNLGCSYCYAEGGTYYNTDGLVMDPETAMRSVDRAAEGYSRIHHINFFGGEPTQNLKTIELVCEYVRFLHQRGDLRHMPSFGITTNGYRLSDRVFDVLRAYEFTATISLDGPREIQDLKRPTKGGSGSFDSVARTADRLLELGLEIEFECTFTRDHLRQGHTIVSLMDFFRERFGCKVLHCPIVSAAPDSPEYLPFETCLELQGDAVEYSLRNLAAGVPNATSTAVRLLHSLRAKAPIYDYCPAGRSEVTVNADGDVYACFMLMQDRSYAFGSVARRAGERPAKVKEGPLRVLDDSPEPGSRKQVIEDFIADADKYKNPACKQCWAQPLCHGCLGEDFERLGKRVERSAIPGESAFCDYKRALIERFLLAVAQVSRGSDLPAFEGRTMCSK